MNLNEAIKLAIQIAKQSNAKHKIGCVIFDKKNHIATWNQSFSVQTRGKYSNHAEAIAITHAIHLKFNFKKSTLIVVRINNQNMLMLAKPCKACTNLIKSV